jgi:hypothetical protein
VSRESCGGKIRVPTEKKQYSSGHKTALERAASFERPAVYYEKMFISLD